MNFRALLIAAALALTAAPAWAGPLSVTLTPGPANPPSPQMGDNLSFHTVIRNDATTPVDSVIAWLSLVQIDKGKEQPVDLEDWSAHKAVTAASLAPGENLETDWRIRPIQSGTYRVVVSAVTRDSVGSRQVRSPALSFARSRSSSRSASCPSHSGFRWSSAGC